jgi:hypothetical protein
MHAFKIFVVLLSAIALWPHQSAAMTIEQFDRMVAEDRRHYIAFLVNAAMNVLVEQGQPELAMNVERLFREIPSGHQQSAGEQQFEKSLSDARASSLKFILPQAPSSEVQAAFCDALLTLGITPSPSFTAGFGPATYNRVFFQKEVPKP